MTLNRACSTERRGRSRQGLWGAGLLVALGTVVSCSSFNPSTGPLSSVCKEADSNPAKSVSFAYDLRPILDRAPNAPNGAGCKVCHYQSESGEPRPGIEFGKLELTTLGALRKGGASSGELIVVPGKPCESVLVQKLRGTYTYGSRMPRGGPYLTDAEVQLFMDWIAEGAKGDDSE